MVTSPLSKRQSRKSVKEFRPKPYKEKAKSSEEIEKEENFVIDAVPGKKLRNFGEFSEICHDFLVQSIIFSNITRIYKTKTTQWRI